MEYLCTLYMYVLYMRGYKYPSDSYYDVSVVRILGCAFTSEPIAHALPCNTAYPVRLT